MPPKKNPILGMNAKSNNKPSTKPNPNPTNSASAPVLPAPIPSCQDKLINDYLSNHLADKYKQTNQLYPMYMKYTIGGLNYCYIVITEIDSFNSTGLQHIGFRIDNESTFNSDYNKFDDNYRLSIDLSKICNQQTQSQTLDAIINNLSNQQINDNVKIVDYTDPKSPTFLDVRDYYIKWLAANRQLAPDRYNYVDNLDNTREHKAELEKAADSGNPEAIKQLLNIELEGENSMLKRENNVLTRENNVLTKRNIVLDTHSVYNTINEQINKNNEQIKLRFDHDNDQTRELVKIYMLERIARATRSIASIPARIHELVTKNQNIDIDTTAKKSKLPTLQENSRMYHQEFTGTSKHDDGTYKIYKNNKKDIDDLTKQIKNNENTTKTNAAEIIKLENMKAYDTAQLIKYKEQLNAYTTSATDGGGMRRRTRRAHAITTRRGRRKKNTSRRHTTTRRKRMKARQHIY